MSEQHQEEALGLALANHTLVVALARTMAMKGLLTQDELDGAVNDSLTVLETAVPDRDAVRTARLILEQMLVANPFPARAKALTTTD
ncbi:MAG TPA: hypothetical protein VGM25_14960 [Caulobacteraceae bacterium]|jgi:hypothetical protein